MRAMLDELMGKERNLPPEERTGKGISYKDAEICKYALAGLCPYGLFKNTKSDLGKASQLYHVPDLVVVWNCLLSIEAASIQSNGTYGFLTPWIWSPTAKNVQGSASMRCMKTMWNFHLQRRNGINLKTVRKNGDSPSQYRARFQQSVCNECWTLISPTLRKSHKG